MRLKKHRANVHSVKFDCDETRIGSAGYDNLLVVWDFPTGDILFEFQKFTDGIFYFAFFEDKNRIALCSMHGHIMILDHTKNTTLFENQLFSVPTVCCLLTSDFQFLIMGQNYGAL